MIDIMILNSEKKTDTNKVHETSMATLLLGKTGIDFKFASSKPILFRLKKKFMNEDYFYFQGGSSSLEIPKFNTEWKVISFS